MILLERMMVKKEHKPVKVIPLQVCVEEKDLLNGVGKNYCCQALREVGVKEFKGQMIISPSRIIYLTESGPYSYRVEIYYNHLGTEGPNW